MIEVGIDIGKTNHLVAVSRDGSSPQVFSMENTPAGRADLINRLGDDPDCRIGLEQVGGWAGQLDQQLLSAGYRVFTIHPLRLARTRELFGQPHKTDQQDALGLMFILQQASRGLMPPRQANQLRPVIKLSPELSRLKHLSRHYHRLGYQHQSLANQLNQLAAVWLPGLTRIFRQPAGLGCLGLLSQSPCPSEWSAVHAATIVSWFRRATDSRRLRFEYARRVKAFAAGDGWEKLPPGIGWQIKQLAQMLLVSARLKLQTLAEIKTLMESLSPARALMTLPGCGPVLGATILTELAPIERFKSHHQVAMYAGLTRLRYESGQSRTSRKVRLVNRRLKWAFHQLALINRRYCPLSGRYVAKHLNGGKTARRAQLALARQLVKVAVALIKTGQPFNPDGR